jgi:hypothetical protein
VRVHVAPDSMRMRRRSVAIRFAIVPDLMDCQDKAVMVE